MRYAATLVLLAVAAVAAGREPQSSPPRTAPPSARLYVLDGGVLESDPGRYRLKPDEVARTQLSVAAYLVVHPKGTLMWDSGAVGDDTWTPGDRAVRRHLVMSNGQDRYVTIQRSLGQQLAAAGFSPDGIDFFAFSHYHWDHVGNANLFARATWLVRQVERDALFPKTSPIPPYPSGYGYLQNSKTTILNDAEHDVFGDGSVVIKSSPGHTPGHQVLAVRLAKTGLVVLSGDLYHYPEERTLRRLPPGDFNEAQTRASREELDRWMARTGAQLWIQHDLVAHEKLRKAPEFYD